MAVQAAPEGVELRAVSERPTFVRFWGVAWGEAAMAAKVVVVVAAEQSAVRVAVVAVGRLLGF